MKLADRLNHRANGLNLLRLILAASVIVWHSVKLTDREIDVTPVRQALAFMPVDGFFAISGFLIAGSWRRRPEVVAFLQARVLRIFPGFWVCLAVTAMVLAPIGVLASGRSLPAGYGSEAIYYLLNNLTLTIRQLDIAGTPLGVPDAGVWNGSLWTLRWEFSCYVGVLLLGLLGLLARRSAVVVLFVGAVLGFLVVHGVGLENYFLVQGTRFAVMFLAGVVVFALQDRLPDGRTPITIAAILVLGSLFLPAYQPLGALPFAYLLIAGAARVTDVRLALRNDVSYGVYIYAFPIQQILAGTRLVDAPVMLFAALTLILTLPLAAASWFAVERPALRLKNQPIRIGRIEPASSKGP